MENVAVKHFTNRKHCIPSEISKCLVVQIQKMSSTAASRPLMKVAKHMVIDMKNFAQLCSSYLTNHIAECTQQKRKFEFENDELLTK